MNWKFYIRGLGIGILVTAAILSFSAPGSAGALSDDDVRERALALGIIDNVAISQLASGEAEVATPTASPAPTAAATPTASPTPSPSPSPEALPSPTEADNTSGGDTDGDSDTDGDIGGDAVTDGDGDTLGDIVASGDGEIVVIQINSGDDSYRVSSRLENAGLVPLASEFNNYLIENGYSRSLRPGSHEIMMGTDFETMARILCGRSTAD